MFEESQPVTINKFKGMFARGDADNCPKDHFIDCLNVILSENGVETRAGLEEILTVGTIRRTHLYKRINESARLIILNQDGELFDSAISLVTPILTIATMTDFSAANMYNRVYISPHNGIKGLPNEKVYVYDGTTLRAAGGIQPTGTLVATLSATAGVVEEGTHLFGVVNESASGFLSKPGPALFAVYNSNGTKKVDLSGIEPGPTGTVRRRIIATRAVAEYDGNQFGQEWFFIPDGVINDNVTTTITVDFYDAALSEDAGYLFDILDEIPAGLVIGTYKARLIVANFDDNQFMARVSYPGEPEVMDSISGIIIVDPAEPGGITNMVEQRDLLGITKSWRSYITSDNGDTPNTWEVLSLDKGIGTEVHGISSILDSTGSHSDRFFLASRGGLTLFEGSFKKPELSWKIEDVWKRINPLYFNKVVVAYDSINNRIYVSVPLDDATSCSHVLYGDCSDGLTHDKIAWTIWDFPFSPVDVIVDIVGETPVLKIAGDNVYKQTAALNDDSTAINSFVKLGLVPESNNGLVSQFNAIVYRITGSGFVLPELRGLDNSGQILPPAFNLSLTPGKDILRKINFVGEKMSLRLDMSSIDEYFRLNSLDIYYNVLWSQRPQ